MPSEQVKAAVAAIQALGHPAESFEFIEESYIHVAVPPKDKVTGRLLQIASDQGVKVKGGRASKVGFQILVDTDE